MSYTPFSEFIKGTERLIKPTDVTAISFLNTFTRLLPRSIQTALMANTAKRIPHMGFVIEPYSVFLGYRITNLEAARALISPDYELIKTKIFANDEPDYYLIFGCVTAHTSAFWGSRIEMYVIAEHKPTGLLSWVIVDYDTNTNSHDPKRGLTQANCSNSVMTTMPNGTVLVDMQRDDQSRRLEVEVNSKAGVMTPLDERLWLEGNLSIDYGTKLSTTTASRFSLTFDPQEVEEAFQIPLNQVHIKTNNWYPELHGAEPQQVACFPYAQHFITGSYPAHQTIANKMELVTARQALGDLSRFKGFSAQPLKRQLALGLIISNTITAGLILYLLLSTIRG